MKLTVWRGLPNPCFEQLSKRNGRNKRIRDEPNCDWFLMVLTFYNLWRHGLEKNIIYIKTGFKNKDINELLRMANNREYQSYHGRGEGGRGASSQVCQEPISPIFLISLIIRHFFWRSKFCAIASTNIGYNLS